MFVDRRLSEHQLDEMRDHIDSCDPCRELLVELVRSNKQLAMYKDALAISEKALGPDAGDHVSFLRASVTCTSP